MSPADHQAVTDLLVDKDKQLQAALKVQNYHIALDYRKI